MRWGDPPRHKHFPYLDKKRIQLHAAIMAPRPKAFPPGDAVQDPEKIGLLATSFLSHQQHKGSPPPPPRGGEPPWRRNASCGGLQPRFFFCEKPPNPRFFKFCFRSPENDIYYPPPFSQKFRFPPTAFGVCGPC